MNENTENTTVTAENQENKEATAENGGSMAETPNAPVILSKAHLAVLHAIPKLDPRKILHGAHVGENHIEATDGKVMLRVKLDTPNTIGEMIIDTETLLTLSKTLKTETEKAKVTFLGERRDSVEIEIETNGVKTSSVIGKSVAGQFPHIDMLIPKATNQRTVFGLSLKTLTQLCKMVKPLATDRGQAIRFSVGKPNAPIVFSAPFSEHENIGIIMPYKLGNLETTGPDPVETLREILDDVENNISQIHHEIAEDVIRFSDGLPRLGQIVRANGEIGVIVETDDAQSDALDKPYLVEYFGDNASSVRSDYFAESEFEIVDKNPICFNAGEYPDSSSFQIPLRLEELGIECPSSSASFQRHSAIARKRDIIGQEFSVKLLSKYNWTGFLPVVHSVTGEIIAIVQDGENGFDPRYVMARFETEHTLITAETEPDGYFEFLVLRQHKTPLEL